MICLDMEFCLTDSLTLTCLLAYLLVGDRNYITCCVPGQTMGSSPDVVFVSPTRELLVLPDACTPQEIGQGRKVYPDEEVQTVQGRQRALHPGAVRQDAHHLGYGAH